MQQPLAGLAAAAAAAMQQPLHGCPKSWVFRLEGMDLSANDLQASLDNLEADGHVQQLQGYKPPADVDLRTGKKNTSGYRAAVCYLLHGHFEHAPKSPEVLSAVAYTAKTATVAAFKEDQQHGAICIKVHLTVPHVKGKTKEQQQQALQEKLKLHAVAVLHWRLQHVAGLPLGEVLVGRAQQQEAAAAAQAMCNPQLRPQHAVCRP
jgi:hypothetical protein